ncbi:ABC transporter permease [Paenibacillus sp. 1P07SE]|uniref:ABC transporter permease n=1 Tax=Paenibacillus sp. 1P07SE TaxID=3132209 RepID=UPI0039A560B7
MDKQTVSAASRPDRVRGKRDRGGQMPLFTHMRRNPFLYLIALPGIVFYFVFSYMPMYGVLIAFKDFDLTKGILGSPWAGFRNFEFFLTSGKLGEVVYNTLFLNVLFLIGTTVFAVAIALFINEIRVKWFKRVSQSLIFLPYFMSWIVISMMVSAILGGQNPALNEWLALFGLPGADWMFTPEYWPWILLVIRIWQGSGYAAIIYLATITSISDELYEAARIDGASRRQIMVRITLPLLVPTISILTLIAVGKIFAGDFGMIYAIVGDNPLLYPTTDVIDTYVYRAMRQLNDFGMSAAVGLTQSVLGFILIIITNGIVRRFSKESSLF